MRKRTLVPPSLTAPRPHSQLHKNARTNDLIAIMCKSSEHQRPACSGCKWRATQVPSSERSCKVILRSKEIRLQPYSPCESHPEPFYLKVSSPLAPPPSERESLPPKTWLFSPLGVFPAAFTTHWCRLSALLSTVDICLATAFCLKASV